MPSSTPLPDPTPPSNSRPPHPRRPRHTPNPLTIHLSATFTPSTIHTPPTSPTTAPRAGYGLYINSHTPPLHLRISEPLNQRHQTLRNAALAALLTALRLVHPHHPYAVRIISDYAPLRDILYKCPAHAPAADAALWNQLDDCFELYQRDGILVEFESVAVGSVTPKGMQRAFQLARQAVSNHAFCRLCRRNYGRAGGGHVCHPVCFVPPCRGVRFESVVEYERHVERRHPIKVVYPEGGRFAVRKSEKNHTSSDESSSESLGSGVVQCPQCHGLFGDFAALASHVERQCPQALQSWMDHTTIVKD